MQASLYRDMTRRKHSLASRSLCIPRSPQLEDVCDKAFEIDRAETDGGRSYMILQNTTCNK